jgi:hypothetical protein
MIKQAGLYACISQAYAGLDTSMAVGVMVYIIPLMSTIIDYRVRVTEDLLDIL